jgi:predicted DNA-binding transcriptional regulator AlpA
MKSIKVSLTSFQHRDKFTVSDKKEFRKSLSKKIYSVLNPQIAGHNLKNKLGLIKFGLTDKFYSMRTDTIQIFNFTAEDLKNLIIEAIQSELKALKQEAQPKVRYLALKKVVSLLKISPVTLIEWSKQGILPTVQIGGRVLYKESDIDTSLRN